VHHTDAGSQYTSIAFTERLAAPGPARQWGPSVTRRQRASRIGDRPVKTELIKPRGPWRTPEQVEIATLEYVEAEVVLLVDDLSPADGLISVYVGVHHVHESPCTSSSLIRCATSSGACARVLPSGHGTRCHLRPVVQTALAGYFHYLVRLTVWIDQIRHTMPQVVAKRQKLLDVRFAQRHTIKVLGSYAALGWS
jgi:hypothetical protein